MLAAILAIILSPQTLAAVIVFSIGVVLGVAAELRRVRRARRVRVRSVRTGHRPYEVH